MSDLPQGGFDDSFKKFLAGATNGLENNAVSTMSGSEKNSTYLVIATNMGLKLGIRPLVLQRSVPVPNLPADAKKSVPAICFGFRLRAEVCSPDGSILLVEKAFGLPLVPKGAHASIVGGVALCSIPSSGARIHQLLKDTQLVELMVLNLTQTLSSCGATVTQPEQSICEFLNQEYDTTVPPEPEIVFDFDLYFDK